MKIIVNCPDSTRIISVVAVGGALSMWADQSINKAKDGAEIVIEEPKEEQGEQEERKPFMINKECYLEPTVDKNGIPCMAIRKLKEKEHE